MEYDFSRMQYIIYIYIIQVHLENNEFSDLKAPSATRGMTISPRHVLKVLRLQSSLDDDNGGTRGQWYLYCRAVFLVPTQLLIIHGSTRSTETGLPLTGSRPVTVEPRVRQDIFVAS